MVYVALEQDGRHSARLADDEPAAAALAPQPHASASHGSSGLTSRGHTTARPLIELCSESALQSALGCIHSRREREPKRMFAGGGVITRTCVRGVMGDTPTRTIE